MESSFIVANLKSFLTLDNANEWLNTFKNSFKNNKNLKIIICPPFTLLSFFKKFIDENNLEVSLGAQDISPFGQGPYTGEINGIQIKDFADYVLIGHSERRINFKEDEQLLTQKTEQALANGLKPIFLVQDSQAKIPNRVNIVVYEPIFAIGSGSPDSPKNANSIAIELKKRGAFDVLYGGSVNSANVKDYTSESDLEGVVVGGASLEAEEFSKIIQNA